MLKDRTAVTVKRPDRSVTGAVLPLGERDIEHLVAEYREALALDGDRGVTVIDDETTGPGAEPKTAAEVDALARKLYDALVRPVVDALPRSRPDEPLVIVPHGPLWLLPFASLKDDDRYLGDRFSLAHAVTERDHNDISEQPRPDPRNGRAWIVGNPRFPARVSACRRSYRFARLPGAENEARAIAGLFGDRADLFVGATADRLRLDAWHGAYAVVHLATHGVVCPDQPLDSFVLLSSLATKDVRRIPGRSGVRIERTDDPRRAVTLLDALGLPTPEVALADFTYPGILDARTLARHYRLDADLVTLSACQTGLGRVLSEGTIGLSRSLLGAGARSILLSLWRVDDAATERLMTHFYRAYLEHADKARALKSAMRATRADFPHPRDWAGFTLVGAAE